MNGYWGNYKSILDNKGRINFPAKIRKNLSEDDQDIEYCSVNTADSYSWSISGDGEICSHDGPASKRKRIGTPHR